MMDHEKMREAMRECSAKSDEIDYQLMIWHHAMIEHMVTLTRWHQQHTVGDLLRRRMHYAEVARKHLAKAAAAIRQVV